VARRAAGARTLAIDGFTMSAQATTANAAESAPQPTESNSPAGVPAKNATEPQPAAAQVNAMDPTLGGVNP
jgi:hypothetical protein